MDTSNIAHFLFAFCIPFGWAAILRPLSIHLFGGWIAYFFSIAFLSLIVIFGKEFFDSHISTNDLASDALGFFLGLALISSQFQKRGSAIDRIRDGEVSGQKISLRNTLYLIEKIERRSANFYRQVSEQSSNARTSGLCSLLAHDAKKRADALAYTLSGWGNRGGSHELSQAMETALSTRNIFTIDPNQITTPKNAIEVALDHEKKKLSLFSKLKSAFAEDWKSLRFGLALVGISKEVQKLEFCLAELEKEQKKDNSE